MTRQTMVQREIFRLERLRAYWQRRRIAAIRRDDFDSYHEALEVGWALLFEIRWWQVSEFPGAFITRP